MLSDYFLALIPLFLLILFIIVTPYSFGVLF